MEARAPSCHPRVLHSVVLCGWCLFGLLFWVQNHLHMVRILRMAPTAEAEVPSDWVLMAADPTRLEMPAVLPYAKPVHLSGPPPLWTDDYSNLLHVLR